MRRAALNLVMGLMYVLGQMMLTTACGIAGRTRGQGPSSFTTFRVPTKFGGLEWRAIDSPWDAPMPYPSAQARDHREQAGPIGRVEADNAWSE